MLLVVVDHDHHFFVVVGRVGAPKADHQMSEYNEERKNRNGVSQPNNNNGYVKAINRLLFSQPICDVPMIVLHFGWNHHATMLFTPFNLYRFNVTQEKKKKSK
jgi:hypothetical protein